MNMTKQDFSRMRNWMKARISGITLNHSVMSHKEIAIANEIEALRKKLLNSWDEESRRFGLNVAEFKCYYCYRKTKESNKVNYHGEEFYLCNKHYEEHQNEVNANTTPN